MTELMTTVQDIPEDAPRHDQRPAGAHAGCDCGHSSGGTDPWRRGFTRRRMLQGGAALVAALGAQQVTTRFAFSAPAAAAGKNVFVVISLRGGMDGLSTVVPAFEPNYYKFRPNIAIPQGALLPLDGKFGLHPSLAGLHEFWKKGQLAVLPAVATPDQTLSHFEAMDTMERGIADGSGDGWLNRVLQDRADKGVFSAVQIGSSVPTSLSGPAPALAVNGIDSFGLGGLDYIRAESTRALRRLYSGYRHPMARQAADTLRALDVTARLQKTEYAPATEYPGGYFANALKEAARLIKANIGLSIATLDLGGWDMHSGLGRVDGGDMKGHLDDLNAAITAFLTDLGTKITDVTLVTLTEFGRTVHENTNVGTDHGRGFAMLVAGGGVNGGKVYTKWPGLSPRDGYDNSLAATTDYRSVLGEILSRRAGVGNLAKVFPDHKVTPLGVVKAR